MKETLKTIRSQLQTNNLGGLDQRKTDRYFISTVLGALGWNLSNFNETILDYSVKDLEQGAEVYYALCDNNVPLLLVDIRPLYSDLTNKNAMTKTLRTAQYSPAKYLAISNGAEWRLFSIDPEEARLELVVNVNDEDAEEKLSLLSKDAINGGLLEAYVNEHLVEEEQTVDKIKTKNRGYQITDPTHNNVNQLRKKIVNNRSVKDQEISNSLIVETILSVFLETSPGFLYEDISNSVVLKKRVIDSFKKYFS